MASHRSKAALAGLFSFSVCALMLQGAICLPAYAQDAAPATGPTKAPRMQVHVYKPRPGSVDANRLREPLGPRVTERPDAGGPVNTGSGIVYTCDPNVEAATCDYLNTTVAGFYNSTFTNANANVYIVYGSTGLGATNSYTNYLTYDQYVTAYNSIAGKSAIQTSALSALGTYDATPYGGGSGQVSVTVSLGETLGFPASDFTGTTASGDFCTAGTAGCYNAVTTITNDPGTPLYYDNVGGPEQGDAYDFYAVVMHETDEVLGTSSCITTQTTPLSNGCDGFGPDSGETGTPAAVDLFRFSAPGTLVLNSALSTTPGAYFSYDGGTTNGAKGNAGDGKIYNTLDNGDDYADFVYTDLGNCATNEAIQDAEGCPGEDAGLTILNDGGGEINILNAVGFSTPAAISPAVLSTPTPGNTLATTPTKFQWAPVAGVKYYDLHLSEVGFGGSDLYTSGTTTATSVTVGGLPVNGTKIYAALYSYINGAWQHTDATYTGASLALGQLTSPAPGSKFTGTSQTFKWSPVSGITLFDLHLSAIGFGGADVYSSGTIKGTSLNVTGLPSNGERIYARFYSWVGGAWQFTDVEYNAF